MSDGTWTGEVTDEFWGARLGERTLVNIHSPEVCAGRACVIHNPSDHHMRDWELVWRADKRVMERLCPDKRIGHPDPDDMAYHISQGRDYLGVHGCDGCCHE